MNAYSPDNFDPALPPRYLTDTDEMRDIRGRLIRARDIALGCVAQFPDSVTRDICQALVTVSNEFAFAEVPHAALEAALTLCRHLMRDQALAGQLDGTYPSGLYE